jgi:pyruvate formate-lyase/glycerol dehydratase family glycyl radical enzyme
MSQRTEALKQKLQVAKYPLAIEKLRLITESYRETEGEPPIMQRAKALKHVLENIEIFIEDGELIVGNASSKQMGIEIGGDYGIWNQEEIDALKEEGYTISPVEEAELRQLNEYWKHRTLVSRNGELLVAKGLYPFMQSGVVLPPWKSKVEGSGGGYAQSGLGLGPGFYLCGFDFERVLNKGLNSLIKEAETELKRINPNDAETAAKEVFLEAVILANKAVIGFAERFAELAAKLAGEEKDPIRAKELNRLAEICRRVPANPARDFYEALQSFWFIFLMITPSTTAAAGRFDQYMYPFYERDIKAGKIADEEVLELLVCLRIKDMQLNRVSGWLNRKKNAGMAKWHNFTIGGVTADGKDASNQLSHLLLEAALRCPTPHHTLTLRVHENTSDELMLKALEVVKTGIGMPAFVGDKSYIAYLRKHGASLAEARDYVITGCIDVNLVGKSRIWSYGMFIVPLVFDIFMHNGVEPRTGRQLGLKTGDIEDFESFDDFMAAFKRQLKHFMSLAAERNNIELEIGGKWYPDPLRSSLMGTAIIQGKDILERTMPFENGAVLNSIGMINVADSMAVVKKLVFDGKRITMKELKSALEHNWQGEKYQGIRKACLAAPKYGNDDDYVDSLARELYQFWADTAGILDTIRGGKHIPTAISISSQWPGGELTGATPDGRYSGDCLADGTMSAMRGMDTHGPTALIKSAIKIEQDNLQATLMNMKFHPSALKSREDLRKLASLIKTYFAFGGKHIQFNVVDKTTLLEAQKQPENYRDLIVRVAGYSAYFVQLSKAVQDEIIGRTEHSL